MSTVSKTVSDECSVLAFYGIEPSAAAAESFYHTMIKWFNDLDCPPDRLGITGPGHSDKVVSFTRGNAKLRKAGFKGVTDIELSSTIPSARHSGHDYYLTATYDGRPKSWCAFLVARSSLATLSPTSLLPVARSLAQGLKAAYGIGYRMEHRLGPEWDVVGVGYGGEILTGEAYEEARNRARWGDMAMPKQLYREGLLRDVYPWNFLTRPQLVRQVGSMPLEGWIREDASRGTLSALCEGVSLWEVGEGNIPDVRRALRQAGVIFDWRSYRTGGEAKNDNTSLS
jgi:hypothetical protein